MRFFVFLISLSILSKTFAFDSGIIPGHEVITRFAISFAKGYAFRTYGRMELPLWDVYPGESGCQTRNPFVRGNYATDQPGKISEIDLRSYYGVPGILHMEFDGRFQHQHFLRDYGAYGVLSAQATCVAAREHIIRATVEGLRAYPNDVYRAEFFFGHAAHTIQDSFSEAHSGRTNQYFTAYQVCTYGISIPGICQHGQIGLIPFDPYDNVWQLGGGCRIRKTYDCLKPAAQAATLATTGYLLMLNELVKNRITPELAPAFINRYFDVPEIYGGYLSCNSLGA